ncbi:exported protein of unknown function [Cupriavidus taiwanensis]|nr:exported protein of unknown function [Cupriavidus taiwanensis]
MASRAASWAATSSAAAAAVSGAPVSGLAVAVLAASSHAGVAVWLDGVCFWSSMSIRINAVSRPAVGLAAGGKSACARCRWWQLAAFQEWRRRDAETHGYKARPVAIDALLLCANALTKIPSKKNDKNVEGPGDGSFLCRFRKVGHA